MLSGIEDFVRLDELPQEFSRFAQARKGTMQSKTHGRSAKVLVIVGSEHRQVKGSLGSLKSCMSDLMISKILPIEIYREVGHLQGYYAVDPVAVL